MTAAQQLSSLSLRFLSSQRKRKTGETLAQAGKREQGSRGSEIGGLCFVWSSGPRDLRCVKVSLLGGWLRVPQRELAAATESHRKLPVSGKMARPAKTGKIFYRVQLLDINASFRAPRRLLYICVWFGDASDRRTSHADAIQAVRSRPPREDTRNARLRQISLQRHKLSIILETPGPHKELNTLTQSKASRGPSPEPGPDSGPAEAARTRTARGTNMSL
ncbi:hypothetical protein SRHO_G00283750 [Serrasalmus rhombeus]